MTFEEARAQFPVLERIAYLNAGTFGPMSRTALDAVRAELQRDARGGPQRPAVLRARSMELREALRARLAASSPPTRSRSRSRRARPTAATSCSAASGSRPADEIVTTTDGALRPARTALRLGRARRRRRAGARRDPRGGDAAHAAPRPLAGALDDRSRAARPRAAGGDRGSRARRRRPVGRRDPGRRCGRRLPHDLGPEMALRAGLDGRARRGRAGGAPGRVRRATSRRRATSVDGTFEPGRARRGSSPAGGRPPRSRGCSPRSTCGPTGPSSGQLAWRSAAVRCSRPASIVTPGGALDARRLPRPAAIRPSSSRPSTRQDVHVREIPGTGLVRVSCGWWTSDGDLERLLAALPG